MAIAAHPDDIEFVMSGTLLRLQAAGYEIHYLNIANGCCGSTEADAVSTELRRRNEAIEACRRGGFRFHESLTDDLAIFYDRPTLARLAAIVRQVAPEVLLVHSPSDYMEDHTNACRLAVTAAFSRGMPNFPVDPPTPTTDQPVTLYHAQPHGNRDALGQLVWPSIFVDVTELMPRKLELLAAHESQRRWLDTSQGLDSYLETMRVLLREVGAMSRRFDYAEGWRQHSHWGFCDPQADPLCAALGSHVRVSA
jgi:LmbE family N-acetylglucosaminyl deacetylase